MEKKECPGMEAICANTQEKKTIRAQKWGQDKRIPQKLI